MKEPKEILEYAGPPLPPDYEPPGLWDEWDALDLDGKPRAQARAKRRSQPAGSRKKKAAA